jgi:hypothetical protein
VEEEIYYEDPGLLGCIESIDYHIEYEVNCEDIEDETWFLE